MQGEIISLTCRAAFYLFIIKKWHIDDGKSDEVGDESRHFKFRLNNRDLIITLKDNLMKLRGPMS